MEVVAYRGVKKSVYRDKKGVERHVKNNESASPIFFSEDQRYASQQENPVNPRPIGRGYEGRNRRLQ